jgi:hypothetical protein
MSSPPWIFTGFLAPDDPRWPEALRKVHHDIFHLPGYLKAWAMVGGGEPLLLLLDAGSSGMLVPLVKRSLAPLGSVYRDFHDAASPYGYPGPVYWGDSSQPWLRALHQELTAQLTQARIVSLFLRLHPFLGTSAETLAALGGLGDLRLQGPVVYLDLRDPEASWQGINPANRRAIRRTLESGCKVCFDQWETMDLVIAAYTETMKRHAAPASYLFPREFFQFLRHGVGPHLHLATSYDGRGAVTGGVFFSEMGGLIQYFLTGTFGLYASISPSKLLVNALRLWGLERGCHTLNLGGGLGAREDSLHTFKIRLSKNSAAFHTLRMVILPEVYRELSGGREDADDFFPSYRRPELPSGPEPSVLGQA